MKPEHCGFGRSLESLTPGDRRAVEDFKAYLEGRVALTADGKTYVPFSDPRAAIRVCGCQWESATNGRLHVNGKAMSGRVVRWVERCDGHAEMCRSIEAWEHEILEAS